MGLRQACAACVLIVTPALFCHAVDLRVTDKRAAFARGFNSPEVTLNDATATGLASDENESELVEVRSFCDTNTCRKLHPPGTRCVCLGTYPFSAFSAPDRRNIQQQLGLTAAGAWDAAFQPLKAEYRARAEARRVREAQAKAAAEAAVPHPSPRDARPDNPGLGFGTGFFITTNGYLATAYHVVSNASRIHVSIASNSYLGRAVAFDQTNDIAVLKINALAPCLPIARTPSPKGEHVCTVGFPMPHIDGFEPAFTEGVINRIGTHNAQNLYQISAEISPGNSGGPLCDDRGNVVGIIVSKRNAILRWALTGDLPQNVNFAVKISYLEPLLQQIGGIGPLMPCSTNSMRSADCAREVGKAVALIIVEIAGH